MSEIAKRIAPAHTLELEAREAGGGVFKRTLKLCFDFAAFAQIKDRTGIELWKDPKLWARLDESAVLPVVLWAAALRYQPAYDSEDGLEAMRSYIDPANAVTICDALFEAYLISLPDKMANSLREMLERAKAGTPEPEANPTNQTPASPASV